MTRSKTVAYAPDYATPPGDYLQDFLNQAGMSQSDLAARTGLSTKHVNQIINGVATITPETAVQLDRATNIAAQVWSGFEANYRAHLASVDARARLSDWREWLEKFNLRELADRGVLTSSTPADDLVEELLRFFGISDPSGWTRVWEPSFTSFRQSAAFEPNQRATTVWLRIGQLKARQVETAEYDAKYLRSLIPELRSLTQLQPVEGLAKLPDLLAPAGVAVVYASGLDGCRASGATWWASPSKAVVLLSDRGKREDRFWFSLFHELGHVLLHPKRATFLDQKRADDADERPPWDPPTTEDAYVDGDGPIDGRSQTIEREADDFAADALIGTELGNRIQQLKSEREIRNVASSLSIAPGIVAGRWQYLRNDYSKFNRLRRSLPEGPFLEPVHQA